MKSIYISTFIFGKFKRLIYIRDDDLNYLRRKQTLSHEYYHHNNLLFSLYRSGWRIFNIVNKLKPSDFIG